MSLRSTLKRDFEKRHKMPSTYYDDYFKLTNLRKSGVVQNDKKSYLDRVSLDKNEYIHLFGFDKDTKSYFELTLSIVGLDRRSSCKSVVGGGYREPGEQGTKWFLAKVKLVLYFDCSKTKEGKDATRYTYECEELLDYEERRQSKTRHETKNIYKIGSLSIETVLPYSLTRIYFNGLMLVKTNEDSRLKPVKLTISTHPTCDKFNYSERFNEDYLLNTLEGLSQDNDNHLNTFLDLRFDQPLMFQGELEDLSKIVEEKKEERNQSFIMWGAKVKKRNHFLIEPSDYGLQVTWDCLFAWSECGHQIHLSRPKDPKLRGLIIGMVHNSCDYASPLYELKLYKRPQQVSNGDSSVLATEKLISFDELSSFSELTSEHVIKVRAFKSKEYTLEFCVDADRESIPGSDGEFSPRRIKINTFDGWAACKRLDLGARTVAAQESLWTLRLHDDLFTPKLAEENLLGGKGNSLVNLVQFTSANNNRCCISVPRGLVVTTEAYNLWLASYGDKIAGPLRDLDSLRCQLAAKSVHVDPLSSEHVSAGDAQKRLRSLCDSTRSQLIRDCPLPAELKRRLELELCAIFGGCLSPKATKPTEAPDDGGPKLFAVRSSCVGEDSLETSAAGQMKTILDASSFDSICCAILECWLSQFSLEALTYKSQNGLAFNLPMGVVVQELIECHAAGVAATCDPLTGNKCQLEITGNLGMGESVVAGKQTDTMRISLERQAGEIKSASSTEVDLDKEILKEFDAKITQADIEKLSANGTCCLSDEQILEMAKLLLELRRTSGPLKEREVEWGLTLKDNGSVHIHLLQSRPLTHLQRLSAREIDHELDSGLPSPLDLASRANLGEVMPGALCPLNMSWLMPITSASATHKPYESIHSRSVYASDQFGYHARMIVMMITYGDTLRRFGGGGGDKKQRGEPEEEEDTTARDVIYSMIGSTFDEPKTAEERARWERFVAEKVTPVNPEINRNFLRVLAADAFHFALEARARRAIKSTLLSEDLASIDKLSGAQTPKGELFAQINLLYERLLTRTQCLAYAWHAHMMGTITNMALNALALKLMCTQPAYKERTMIASDVLNDFSVLMRGSTESSSSKSSSKTTESGDISKLIEQLLECFVEEKLIEHMRTLTSVKELYDFLNSRRNQKKFKCARLYARFMRKNGHRAYKEFDLATKSWSDDQSYIMRLLASRLKSFTREVSEKRAEHLLESDRLQAEQLARVQAKLTTGSRHLLTKFALPRARNATIRRETSKSLLIRAVHKYRLAFRHLGGLLCLAGLMPSADLIFYLTLEEIDEIIRRCCCTIEHPNERADVMPRLLYKARRRQQRTRAYDSVTFPRPTLSVMEALQTIKEQSELSARAGSGHQHVAANGEQQQQQQVGVTSNGSESTGEQKASPRVEGIISCAGCVTGRACVISSLDDIDDQLEPNDILITYSIDISWSVYFYQLAGIVTEVGGIVSHGAVIAREYGLPTLCTAVGACSIFKTGQIVTLDASKGVCYLAPGVNADKVGEDK